MCGKGEEDWRSEAADLFMHEQHNVPVRPVPPTELLEVYEMDHSVAPIPISRRSVFVCVQILNISGVL